jgi:hypothetical protein
MLDKSSAVVRNVPFASTSKDFRAALLQRSASSRRRPEQFVTGMGARSRLVDSGACPDWCKIQVTWFDHLAGQNVAGRWSYLTLDGLDRFNKGALMTGSEPSQLRRVRGAQCSCMCVIALILNELITNATKYAYEGRDGRIFVRFAFLADDVIELGVRDEGVGLPPGFQLRAARSLGMRIVLAFVQQLNAKLTFDRLDPGTEFVLLVPR